MSEEKTQEVLPVITLEMQVAAQGEMLEQTGALIDHLIRKCVELEDRINKLEPTPNEE